MTNNSKDNSKSGPYIFGRNAIIEAIRSGKAIEKIYLTFGAHGAEPDRLMIMAKKSHIPQVQYDKRKFLEFERSALPAGIKTQGAIALMATTEQLSLEEIIEIAYKKEKNPLIIALDGINDPHNLGAIARSAECAGFAAMVLTERNSAPITPVAVKASAGALEHLPVARVTNMVQSLETLKESGFWVAGTDAAADKIYTGNLYDSPMVLVVGSEGEGMRPATRKHCDLLVHIPLFGSIESLNASVAAAVVMFEIRRQRMLIES